jgi:hypothetical protein
LIRLQRAVGGPGVVTSQNLAGPTTAPATAPATRPAASRPPREPDDYVANAPEAQKQLKNDD